MRKVTMNLAILAGLILLGGLVLGACAPLATFNAITPADAAELAESNISYGPDLRQRLDVYRPQGQTSPAPVIVFFYGGSWNSGHKEDYAFAGKAFAAQGFVVVVADYRLVPQVRFPAFLEDGAKIIAWTKNNARRFGGNPDQLFVLGHSAGAYIAVMLGLDGKYLRGAGLDPSTITAVAALAGPYDFLPFDVSSTIEAFGRAPDPGATQPVNFVTRAAPPMLLATGDEDTTVKPRNTRRLAALLKAANTNIRAVEYPGVGHVGIMLALSRPFRSNAPVVGDVTAFFRDQIARRPNP